MLKLFNTTTLEIQSVSLITNWISGNIHVEVHYLDDHWVPRKSMTIYVEGLTPESVIAQTNAKWMKLVIERGEMDVDALSSPVSLLSNSAEDAASDDDEIPF